MSWTMEWKQTQNYKGVACFLEDEQQRFSMAVDRNSQFETAEEIVNVLNAAVAAERERCARMLEARARVMLEAWEDYMYGHSNAKHRADSARAETLCEAAAAIRAGEQEE